MVFLLLVNGYFMFYYLVYLILRCRKLPRGALPRDGRNINVINNNNISSSAGKSP